MGQIAFPKYHLCSAVLFFCMLQCVITTFFFVKKNIKYHRVTTHIHINNDYFKKWWGFAYILNKYLNTLFFVVAAAPFNISTVLGLFFLGPLFVIKYWKIKGKFNSKGEAFCVTHKPHLTNVSNFYKNAWKI